MARKVSNSEFGRLLKGSDVVAAGKDIVAGIVLEVRDSPQGFGSPYIVDFDTDLLPGTHSWPCNVTQARRLADLTKEQNPDKWAGFAIGLEVVQQNNPKEAARLGVPEYLVDSLAVAFVTVPKEAAKKRKTKPKYFVTGPASASQPAGRKSFTDEDVPF
jgi:hypothetical protein